ncbi:MAG: hypothetical protein FWH10_07580 [Oscillospiraceae bacterium]|nr:hypothetical protein [Oscillospiraceae bacterium]
MTNREYVSAQLNELPESVIEKIIEFIAFQKYTIGLYENDTDYLTSVPGMADKIKEGLKTPLSECSPLSEVWADV